MAVLSAAVAGSTPLTSYAAEVKSVQRSTDKCYQVYIGQGTESLSQNLKDLGIAFGNGAFCPDTEKPETEAPPVSETPEKPETETPPVTEKPDAEALSYAEQVVALVNAERAKAGLSALEMNEDITAAANVRAKEIKQKFAHTRPDGSSFSSALKEQGASFRGSGENIAWGQKSPEQVMNGWMDSDGHRANILNKNYKNIGVGYYQDENGVNYWVQLFTY